MVVPDSDWFGLVWESRYCVGRCEGIIIDAGYNNGNYLFFT
jgi:hypothetical protein